MRGDISGKFSFGYIRVVGLSGWEFGRSLRTGWGWSTFVLDDGMSR